MEELSQYDMNIKHRSGKLHGNADGLSRIGESEVPCPGFQAELELSDLPCKGCTKCERHTVHGISLCTKLTKQYL